VKVAYVSDLHLDFYAHPSKPIKLMKFIETLFKDTEVFEVLIIAGDLSHYNSQIINFLENVKQYAHNIIFVGGNHECYNISKKMQNKYLYPYDRLDELKELIKPLANVYMLDGEAVTINGKVFAGAMGWYDGSYYYKMKNFPRDETLMSYWGTFSNDSVRIPRLHDFMDMFNHEIKMVKKAVATKPDIMITHFCPTSELEAISEKYRYARSTGFYTFDGASQGLFEGVPIWIHGHLHDKKEYVLGGTKFLRNPIGYPKENKHIGIEYFEIL